MTLPRGLTYADADPEQPDPQPGPERTDAPEQLDWLTGDELKVAQKMVDLWVEYSKIPETMERESRWKVNELRRDGWVGVRLVRDGDYGTHRPWVPMGGKANLELANEARRLCRVFVGNMFADPPAPQVFPADSGADDRDTADVSERALMDLQSDRRLNTGTKLRDATDTACTYGSGYIVYQIDPTAGGRRARTMMASPLSPSPEAPLLDPTTGMPYAPPVDPMAAMDPMFVPEPPPEPVERMVGQDEKSFTEDPAGAAYDWTPGIRSEVLSGRNVRLIPHTAENVWEAHGVMVGTFQPLKVWQSMFPEQLGKLTDEEKDQLVGFRPHGADELLPLHRRGRQTTNENALVFGLVVCYRECAQYPDGFYGVAIGNRRVPFRQEWISYANGEREALLLPVSQVKLFRNGKSDPAGDGLMDDLGAMSEVQAAQIGHLLAYLDWFNNPQVFVPLGSNIQDADILARKPIVRILPGGEPKTLQPPRYPAESLTMYELMRDGASKAAHLMDTAQGMEDPNVKSGRHAYQIVAQAHAQLSEPKQNIERAYVRCCEIELQYARAFGIDGEARWTGDDGTYKVKKWTGADLGGDVKLQPGTMTMLSPAAKAQLVEQWMGAMIISPEEGREMLSQGIGAVIGLRDNSFRLEIRRQIATWEEGPPEGWMPIPPGTPQMDPATGQPMLDPMTGMPVPMVDPAVEQIWQPRAHHNLPGVAQMRVDELAKLMATARFHGMPREWQAIAEQEMQRCMMIAAPPAPMVDEEGKPVEGGAGGAAPGQESFGSPQSQLPALDNPALTGGQPGGQPAVGAPVAA
jgi:hypothetical protein